MAALLLTMHASPGEAAMAAPGLWAGLWDGFVSLLRFLMFPLFEAGIFDGSGAESSLYLIGYFLGVLAFAVVAGSAASAEDG